MGETVRMYEPLQGRLPPGARFGVDTVGRVVLFFTCQAVELFGIGIEYRSADLYHVRDSELDAERIMLDLFEAPDKGQGRLIHFKSRPQAKMHVTSFIRQFEVGFKEHHNYPVWATGSHLYVDL